jgi:hypothetical protein
MHLTDLSLKALPFEEGRQRDYTDDSIPGLTLRVGKRTKTFMLLVGSGKTRRRHKIGRYPKCTLQVARAKARTLIGEHSKERDSGPVTINLGEALTLFLDIHCKQNNKSSTAKETERLLNRHLKPKLEKRRMPEIKTADLTQIVDSLKDTPSEANHLFTASRTFFRWAAGRQYVSKDPLGAQKRPCHSPRTGTV